MNILKMYKIEDAASFMKISKNDTEALIRSGKLKAFNLGSASAPRYYLRKECLVEYLNNKANALTR